MSWPMRVFSDTACGRAKTRLRKAYISACVRRYDRTQSRAAPKRSGGGSRRGFAVATTHVVIAPDLSHACTLHRKRLTNWTPKIPRGLGGLAGSLGTCRPRHPG